MFIRNTRKRLKITSGYHFMRKHEKAMSTPRSSEISDTLLGATSRDSVFSATWSPGNPAAMPWQNLLEQPSSPCLFRNAALLSGASGLCRRACATSPLTKRFVQLESFKLADHSLLMILMLCAMSLLEDTRHTLSKQKVVLQLVHRALDFRMRFSRQSH